MSFFQLVLKARKLEKARLRYEDEKLRSIEIFEGVEPRLTFKQRLRRKKLKYRNKFKRVWSKIISPIKHTWVYERAKLLCINGSFENYILKSMFGFLGGIFLTYMFFVFFVIQLSFTFSSATMLCAILGVILTLGLAFSHRVRCIVFLLLPQFFSKRGRQALMAYAFILTFTGPAKNILHNISVLSESLACEQDQLKQAVKNVVDLIKEPFYALRDAITKVLKTVKVLVKKIKQTLLAIKRLVLSILRVITSVFQWLGSIVNICNKKLGTPFDRCQRVFDGAVSDCKAKLGPLFGRICNLTYVVGALCYVVKPLDFICTLVSYVADTIVNAVRKKIEKFTRHLKAMFYVKVKFSHSFHFETNQSKTLEDVSTDIIIQVRSRTDRFLAVFDWMNFMTTFFIFFMLLRILHYRYKWLTSERFDNRYLTDDLRTIDLIRTRQDKETILPLNRRERNQYIPLTSITLIKIEKIKLAKSAVFLCLATFKICIYMIADYSLYWILNVIRHHGQIETKVQRPNFVGVYVSGDGYLADLYRSIVKAFTLHAKDMEIDMTFCLPDPIPPDFDRYTQIVTLIAFSWIMTIFEPYGLRLRHVVMCNYYPERAKQRAAWLYNHIIRSRGNFIKFARRQLRRKFGMTENEQIERVTFRERCLAICPFLNKLFPRKQNVCLLCGAVERSDQEPHIKCATPDCVGLFCIQCFADLQNLCTICRSPVEYGDLSDISEEKDSSDDQLIVKKGSVPIITNIDKKEEPVGEEKPKEEIVATEKVEEPSEERISEEIEAEEFVVEEEISRKISEKKEGGIERIIVEKRDEAVQTDGDIDESSSDSVYSYTYRKGSREIEMKRRRVPFKDIEAQKIREDVTIQIFNEPLAKDITSSSEDSTSCFVVRARRRLRARLKRKSRFSPRKDDSSSSTSIADTESCSTEKLDEEEVIHIEMDDGSKELLLKNGTGKAGERSTRVGRILAALTKISWLGKRTTTDSDGEWRTRKPSLLDRIARMLPRNQTTSPVRMYRRIRTAKKDVKRKDSSSVSSSVSDEGNERSTLLKARDRQVDCLQIISDHNDSGDNIYSRNYDSHRGRRGTIYRQPDSHARADDATVKYPHEKKFAAKELPRHLQPISRDTAYFEVDEIKDSQLKRKCVRSTDRVNVLSDTGIFDIDNKRRDKWNITRRDNYAQIPCACTPQIFSHVRDSGSESNLSAITEQSNEISTTNGVLEMKTEKIVTTNETMTDSETDRQKDRKKTLFENGQRKLLAKNNRASVKSNNTAEENGARKCDAKNKQAEELAGVEKGKEKMMASTSVANDKARLYDPLASLELYGVTCQVKGREKLAVEKLTKQSGAPEICIDRKTAKFVRDIEMVQKSVQVSEHQVKKSATVSVKSIQANLRKPEKYKRYDKISHIGAKICRATGLGKKEKKEGEKQNKWIDKCKKHRKQRSSEKKPKLVKRKYDVDVTETRLEIPMLKKYLPPYQAPGLIEELKEHDRMRLIQEREARRWTALSALRSTKDSPSSAKSRDRACSTSIICNARETVSELTLVSTRLTEANTLPYQETQTFKDVVREFRKKVIATSERPLISLSQDADKCKDLKQLFPPKNEDHEGFTAAPKFEKVVNRFKPTCDKQKREEECTTIYRAKRKFQSESFSDGHSETSSICSYPRERRLDDSTSVDKTTDNNVDIS